MQVCRFSAIHHPQTSHLNIVNNAPMKTVNTLPQTRCSSKDLSYHRNHHNSNQRYHRNIRIRGKPKRFQWINRVKSPKAWLIKDTTRVIDSIKIQLRPSSPVILTFHLAGVEVNVWLILLNTKLRNLVTILVESMSSLKGKNKNSINWTNLDNPKETKPKSSLRAKVGNSRILSILKT